MRLFDITDEVSDGRERPLEISDVGIVAVHRIWFDDWDLGLLTDPELTPNPIDVLRRFADDPELTRYTGGETPYTFVVDRAGDWWQGLRLADTGAHARRWNSAAVGVAVLGDFRKIPPSPEQLSGLLAGLVDLCQALRVDPLGRRRLRGALVRELSGHDELPGGSADASKACPGPLLDMDSLRADVAALTRARAVNRLLELGIQP